MFSDRETSTVLAALRHFGQRFGHAPDAAAEAMPFHFHECRPLSAAEIDALCEFINNRSAHAYRMEGPSCPVNGWELEGYHSLNE